MTRLHATLDQRKHGNLDLETTELVTDLMVRQRSRLAEHLSALDASDWQRPTRCERWDVRDVVLHLLDTDRWTTAALDGTDRTPSVLERFDPRVTPHEHVLLARQNPPAAPAEALLASSETLAARLRTAEQQGSPAMGWVGGMRYAPGLAVLHLLWDSWLHERDLQLDDGPSDPATMVAVEAYALFLAMASVSRRLPEGTELRFVVHLDDRVYDVRAGETAYVGAMPPHDSPEPAPALSGPGIAVVEALSGRRELAAEAEADPGALEVFGAFARAMRG